MQDYLNAAKAGFKRGLVEAPRGFFAPVIGVIRFLIAATDRETGRNCQHNEQHHQVSST